MKPMMQPKTHGQMQQQCEQDRKAHDSDRMSKQGPSPADMHKAKGAK